MVPPRPPRDPNKPKAPARPRKPTAPKAKSPSASARDARRAEDHARQTGKPAPAGPARERKPAESRPRTSGDARRPQAPRNGGATLRPGFVRPDRSADERPARPTRDRPDRARPGSERAPERPPRERPTGERKPAEFRPRHTGSTTADRPQRARSDGAAPRPTRDRPDRTQPSGERSTGERPVRERPASERKPSGFSSRGPGSIATGRPQGARFDDAAPRPSRDRPERSRSGGERAGDRPLRDRPTGDRPVRGRPVADAQTRAQPARRGAARLEPRISAPRVAAAPVAPGEGERIAKLLARAGIASRREIERFITEGRVAVGGTVIDTPATILKSLHGVTFDGRPVEAPEATRLFRFYKPTGFLTAERDPKGRPTIYDRLPPDLPRLMPVGRLDMNTEGLLLMTTDGGLKRQLELPATGIERVYRARVFGEVSQTALEGLIEGIEIEGVRYGPIDANMERRTGRNGWVEMRLKEGKNREVRRVLEYLGLQVSRLIRTRYGHFPLGDLPPGAVDEVRQHELVAFRKTLK